MENAREEMAFIDGMKATLEKSKRGNGVHQVNESHFGEKQERKWRSSSE
ncbi:hypothetical protein [Ureibacillus chungkukjangi]|nr:hypothetical protein [Ureibacillus chungkukjangi]